jgi:hypothetical protein
MKLVGALSRHAAMGLVCGALLPLVHERTARADEAKPSPALVRGSLEGIDRLTLDNGIRVVVVRTTGASHVAVVEAFGAVAEPHEDLPRVAILPALRASEVFGRGDLSASARAELMSRRAVRESVSLFGDAATRTLAVPANELPLAVYLLAQAQKPARFSPREAAAGLAAPLEAGFRPLLDFRPDGLAAWGETGRSLLAEPFLWGRAGLRPTTDQLVATDAALRGGPLVVVVVGDVESDRTTALLHKYLDDVPGRAREKPGTRAGAFAPPGDAASGHPWTVGPTKRQGVHAVSLTVRIAGSPWHRRVLRAAFEAFVQGWLLPGLKKSGALSSFRSATALEEDAGSIEGVGIRLLANDEPGAERLEKELRQRWAAYLAAGPSAVDLEAADRRVQARDVARWAAPEALGRHVALLELSGERWGSPAFTAAADPIEPARVTPLFAKAFSTKTVVVWREKPTP